MYFCLKTITKTSNQPTNLPEGLINEINKVRELIAFYNTLPNNNGFIGAQTLRNHIANAEKAIRENDIVQMLQAYTVLKELE